jgi:hypothetical protein
VVGDLVRPGCEPLSDSGLGDAVVVDVGGVDQVAAGFDERVELGEGVLLGVSAVPKFIVPRARLETRVPLLPSLRYSMRYLAPSH